VQIQLELPAQQKWAETHFQMGLFNVMISMLLWYQCSFWCYVTVNLFEQGIVGSSVHVGEGPFY